MCSIHSAGLKSFEDVRSVLDDVPYDTHRETCVYLGFLDDGNEWGLVMTDYAAYDMPSQTRATFVILLVCNEVGHPAGLFDKHLRAMGEDYVHILSLEEHPLSDKHIMVLVLVDITRRFEAIDTNVKAFNLPMPSEEEMREVEEIERRAMILRLSTVRRLQLLYGDLGHSRACVDKSMNGDDNGNLKFNNGQRSVFEALMEANDEKTRHIRALLISTADGTGTTCILNTLLDAVRSNWDHAGEEYYDEP
jgi:hypothetical protein